MTVRLYDSRAAAVVDLVPLVPGEVSMYVCGPTVQSSPHVGHLRSALVYDLWRRWLTYRGYRVTLVRNVTDIDDKVLDLAAETDEPWWARAYRVELEFTAGYAALGILPPTYEPRATASIPGMQEIITTLIARGHAYVAADESGDVYFDTGSWPEYGALTHQRREDMVDATDADPRGKRDPRDFALWKGRKDGEPASASWDSPWGAGRPGWHIECSAMSRRYLGPAFDIHGGGLDLRFPHHENELAQSTAAGDPFASYWLHNGIVTTGGQKMSKSLGNSIFAADFLASARPIVARYFLAAAHYRSALDHHEGSLGESEAALERIAGFLDRAETAVERDREYLDLRNATEGWPVHGDPDVPEAFAAAMDDDLAVPQALAVLHETVRAGNAALDADDVHTVWIAFRQVSAMVAVLGIDPRAAHWNSGGVDASAAPLAALVDRLVQERADARAAKDFTTADRVRDDLAAAGITIEDTAGGTRWTVA